MRPATSPAERVVRDAVERFFKLHDVYPSGSHRVDVSFNGPIPPDCADGKERLAVAFEMLIFECVGRLRLGDDT